MSDYEEDMNMDDLPDDDDDYMDDGNLFFSRKKYKMLTIFMKIWRKTFKFDQFRCQIYIFEGSGDEADGKKKASPGGSPKEDRRKKNMFGRDKPKKGYFGRPAVLIDSKILQQNVSKYYRIYSESCLKRRNFVNFPSKFQVFKMSILIV